MFYISHFYYPAFLLYQYFFQMSFSLYEMSSFIWRILKHQYFVSKSRLFYTQYRHTYGVFQYMYTTFSKYRLYYTQCRHTYGVFQDSIPLLCLFSSVSSSDFSLRLVVFACSIIIGTISDLFSCSFLRIHNV